MHSNSFPPKPKFTDTEVPDLTDKVILITGGSSGLGLETSKLLYAKNATLYLAARSKSNADDAIKEIRANAPTSKGKVIFLHLDLADLASVKSAAEDFLAKEKQLHVLYHNAGILTPPPGSVTKQGHELQLGVHCIGPVLLTLLLKDTLKATAKLAGVQPGEVRVVWLASLGTVISPPGGIDLENIDYRQKKEQPTQLAKYNISKAGVYLLSGEFGRRSWPHGVLNIVRRRNPHSLL
jgi:retinol dehydrogenase 12